MDAQDFVAADLSATDQLDELLAGIIDENRETATAFTLFNNAGMVNPIGLDGGYPGGCNGKRNCTKFDGADDSSQHNSYPH